MVALLAWADAVDIGLGRGRLAAPAAASLYRVDAAMRSAFGRAADINEAWRSPDQANSNYAAYLFFLRGGPWAPIALPADESIHCRGYAVDTDDTSTAQMRIWNDHGWFWTVYRNGVLVERWHLEYDPSRDNHRTAGSGAGAISLNPEDDMTPEQFAVLELVNAKLTDVLNAINDSNGILVNSRNAASWSGNANQIASDVRNSINDPDGGVQHKLDTIIDHTHP